MNPDFTSNNEIEQVAAVAAAAYAINAIQESSFPDKTEIYVDHIPSFTRVKSNKQGTSIAMPEPETIPEIQDSKVPVTTATEEKAPEKIVRPSRSMKRTPTFADTKPESHDPGTSVKKNPSFADNKLNGTIGTKPDSRPVVDMPTVRHTTPVPKPEQPTRLKPATPRTQTIRQSSARAGTGETIADAWEREEMAKINERYDKLKAEILSWESKKKKKAKRRLDKTEKESEHKRLKAQRKFHSKIEYIEQIAAEARTQAEGKRRNEKFKVKEKANKIRTTGKIPATCFCF